MDSFRGPEWRANNVVAEYFAHTFFSYMWSEIVFVDSKMMPTEQSDLQKVCAYVFLSLSVCLCLSYLSIYMSTCSSVCLSLICLRIQGLHSFFYETRIYCVHIKCTSGIICSYCVIYTLCMELYRVKMYNLREYRLVNKNVYRFESISHQYL